MLSNSKTNKRENNEWLQVSKVALAFQCYIGGVFIVLQMKLWHLDENTRDLISLVEASNPKH